MITETFSPSIEFWFATDPARRNIGTRGGDAVNHNESAWLQREQDLDLAAATA